MERSLLPLAMTMGDPAGVGPQITWQAWERLRERANAPRFFVIGDADVFSGAAKKLDITARIVSISEPAEAIGAFRHGMPLFHIPCEGQVEPGQANAAHAGAILKSIQTAVDHTLSGKAGGVVTNPISKKSLYDAGFAHPGHTEFLAQLCTKPGHPMPRPVMMLHGGGLRVALVTIHAPLKEAIDSLSVEAIVSVGKVLDFALRRDFGMPTPRIALAGLNPHAGEEGALGSEEIDIINPAAALLRRDGVDCSDALPPDTVFHLAKEGQFDAVIALYHDQGLIPVKTLDLWGGVNVTLGLPIIRTSPDHGVGYPAARTGQVRCDSLVSAVELAARCVDRRFAHTG
jgi:4-hydroxythreonine-4-phosphate dehydrogenase